MFLVNSRLGLFTATTSRWLPFSRSYGVILPSSLTRVLPFVLEFSSRLPVSVCGTGTSMIMLSGFSREYDYPHSQASPKGIPYSQVRLCGWICLPASTPTPFNAHIRQCAEVSLLRLHVAHQGSTGMLTRSAIALAVRLKLRTRLTPG